MTEVYADGVRVIGERTGVVSAPIAHHHIELMLDRYVGVGASFICDGEDGALCRMACHSPGCEEGCVPDSEHDVRPVDYCNLTEWLNNDDAYWWEMYAGDAHRAVSGPIEIMPRVDHEGMMWRYAAEVL